MQVPVRAAFELRVCRVQPGVTAVVSSKSRAFVSNVRNETTRVDVSAFGTLVNVRPRPDVSLRCY